MTHKKNSTRLWWRSDGNNNEHILVHEQIGWLKTISTRKSSSSLIENLKYSFVHDRCFRPYNMIGKTIQTKNNNNINTNIHIKCKVSILILHYLLCQMTLNFIDYTPKINRNLVKYKFTCMFTLNSLDHIYFICASMWFSVPNYQF